MYNTYMAPLLLLSLLFGNVFAPLIFNDVNQISIHPSSNKFILFTMYSLLICMLRVDVCIYVCMSVVDWTGVL